MPATGRLKTAARGRANPRAAGTNTSRERQPPPPSGRVLRVRQSPEPYRKLCGQEEGCRGLGRPASRGQLLGKRRHFFSRSNLGGRILGHSGARCSSANALQPGPSFTADTATSVISKVRRDTFYVRLIFGAVSGCASFVPYESSYFLVRYQ